MPPDLRQRHIEPEWMDAPGADPRLLDRSLRFLRRVNAWLGYTRATLRELGRIVERSDARDTRRPLRVLDVACGEADLARAVLRWGDRQGIGVQVVALDLHARTLQLARSRGNDPRLGFIQADATAMPFEDGSFDLAVTGLFLHHLPDPQVIAALSEMKRVSRLGLVVGDIRRCRRSWLWTWLITRPANPMVRHDGPASVRAAFTPVELRRLARSAGLDDASVEVRFGHRLVLRWSRPNPRFDRAHVVRPTIEGLDAREMI